MSELQRTARAVMVARVLEQMLKERVEETRAAAREAMGQDGVEKVRVFDDLGTNLGTVSLTSGRLTARVVDEAAFTAWVARNYPDETVVTVREAFRRKLLEGAVEKADGEVIPGVEIRAGDPCVVVRATETAKARMRRLLTRSGLLELAAGEPDDHVA